MSDAAPPPAPAPRGGQGAGRAPSGRSGGGRSGGGRSRRGRFGRGPVGEGPRAAGAARAAAGGPRGRARARRDVKVPVRVGWTHRWPRPPGRGRSRTPEPAPRRPASAVAPGAGGAMAITDGEIRANRRRAWLLLVADGLAAGLVVGAVGGRRRVGGGRGGRRGGGARGGDPGAAPGGGHPGGRPGSARRPVGRRGGPGAREPGGRALCNFRSTGPRADGWSTTAVPNACALGRGPPRRGDRGDSGLLDRLDLIEMEGSWPTSWPTSSGTTPRCPTGGRLVALGPLAAGSAGSDRLAPRRRRARSGVPGRLVAAATVRYPPGLRDALTSMAEGPAPAADSVFAARAAGPDPLDLGRPDGRATATACPVGDADATPVRRRRAGRVVSARGTPRAPLRGRGPPGAR